MFPGATTTAQLSFTPQVERMFVAPYVWLGGIGDKAQAMLLFHMRTKFRLLSCFWSPNTMAPSVSAWTYFSSRPWSYWFSTASQEREIPKAMLLNTVTQLLCLHMKAATGAPIRPCCNGWPSSLPSGLSYTLDQSQYSVPGLWLRAIPLACIVRCESLLWMESIISPLPGLVSDHCHWAPLMGLKLEWFCFSFATLGMLNLIFFLLVS